MFPHVWKKFTDKMKEKPRQAIKEKETALALFSDEPQVIQYNNVGLQGEIKAKDKAMKYLIDN